MRELEAVADERRDRESLRSLREELAAYYRGTTTAELCACLRSLALAPGAHEGFDFLRRRGVATAIVSITWEFAAAREMGLRREQTAAVGDSFREIARLIAQAPGAGQGPVAGQAPGAGPAARA